MTSAQTVPELSASPGSVCPEGLDSIPFKALRLDSRQVQTGDCFLALKGNKLDGMSFAADAAQRGAAVVITEEKPGLMKGPVNVPIVIDPDLRKHAGPLFDAWKGFPTRRLQAYGVTGTNGKSTTAFLMSSILRAAGHQR